MRILSFAALILLLTGCRLTLGIDVDLDSAAGGTLVVSVTTDAELEESSAMAGVDPLGRLVERVGAQDGPWRVAESDGEDGSRTVSLTTSFVDPEEFALRYGELRVALDAPEARLLGPLALTRDPETGVMTVQGELPLEVTEVAAADLGTDVATLTDQLADVVATTLTVQTPGPLLSATGAAVSADGSLLVAPYPDEPVTVLWTATPGAPTPQVAATFEPGGSDLLQVLLIGGVALLAVLAIIGGVVAQRRR